MQRAPVSLVKRLRASDRGAFDRWWAALTEEQRASLRDGRRPGLIARYVDDPVHDAPPIDFYEFLVNHEVELEDGTVRHICSAHANARSVIAKGLIPADFACPLRNEDCPMRGMLDRAPGKHVELRLR